MVIELEAGGTKRYPKTQGPVISTAALNEAGLPERLVTASGATILDERRYRWDESGNLVGVEVQDSRGKRSISYMLDSLGRLHRSSTSTDQDVEYELDPAGNRTLVRMDGGAGRYSMEGLDRATNRYSTTPAYL